MSADDVPNTTQETDSNKEVEFHMDQQSDVHSKTSHCCYYERWQLLERRSINQISGPELAVV